MNSGGEESVDGPIGRPFIRLKDQGLPRRLEEAHVEEKDRRPCLEDAQRQENNQAVHLEEENHLVHDGQKDDHPGEINGCEENHRQKTRREKGGAGVLHAVPLQEISGSAVWIEDGATQAGEVGDASHPQDGVESPRILREGRDELHTIHRWLWDPSGVNPGRRPRRRDPSRRSGGARATDPAHHPGR